eukprot:1258732-Pyramimonas_sp.AAC.1
MPRGVRVRLIGRRIALWRQVLPIARGGARPWASGSTPPDCGCRGVLGRRLVGALRANAYA